MCSCLYVCARRPNDKYSTTTTYTKRKKKNKILLHRQNQSQCNHSNTYTANYIHTLTTYNTHRHFLENTELRKYTNITMYLQRESRYE